MSFAPMQLWKPQITSTPLPTLPSPLQFTNPKVAFGEASTGGSNAPGTAKEVEGLLSDPEVKSLYDVIRRLDPSLNNHMVNEGRALSGAALARYVRGAGGLVRLPNNFSESKIYYSDPAAKNTEALIDLVFSGKSKTPNTKFALDKARAVPVGKSITFSDHNNRLINMRSNSVSGMSTKSPAETDRMMTLGNATFNTNAKVTVTNLGAKGYRIDVQSVHVILDRYNWNVATNDPAAEAARVSNLPDGYGGSISANHVDWAKMKKWGAKDYTVGLVVTEQRSYTIPPSAVHGDGMGGYYWRTGELNQYLTSATKRGVVTNPAEFKAHLSRASKQNNKVVPVVDETVSELIPLKQVKDTSGYRKPQQPRGPYAPSQ